MGRPGKIFFGWWTTLVTGAITGLTSGFVFTGASALFTPIAVDLGMTRAAASLATGIGTLQQGLVFPLSGGLCDRFGSRWVAVAGSCLMVLGLTLLYFVTSPLAYYVVWGLIAAGQSLGWMIAIDVMLTNWFVKKRGAAFSLRFATIGVVQGVALPALSWLIATQGWRNASLVWAAIMFATVPFAWRFIRQGRPEHYGMLPDGSLVEAGSQAADDSMVARGLSYAADLQETEFTLKQAMRTSAYWLLAAAWVIQMIVFAGVNVHIIPMLQDRGMDPVSAGSMMAMMVFFMVPARVIGGLAADRVKKDYLKFILAGTWVVLLMGIVAPLAFPGGLGGMYAFLVLYGLGSGAYVPVDIALKGRYFGRKSYGLIQGTTMMFSAPLAFLAPVFTGWTYDVSGSYASAFVLYGVIAVLAMLLVCLVRVPALATEYAGARAEA